MPRCKCLPRTLPLHDACARCSPEANEATEEGKETKGKAYCLSESGWCRAAPYIYKPTNTQVPIVHTTYCLVWSSFPAGAEFASNSRANLICLIYSASSLKSACCESRRGALNTSSKKGMICEFAFKAEIKYLHRIIFPLLVQRENLVAGNVGSIMLPSA